MLLLLSMLAAGSQAGPPPAHSGSPPGASFAPGEPVPALHLRLGPDSNACGITVPSGRASKLGKAGLIVWLHGGMRSQNREKGFEAHRAWIGYTPPGRYYLCSPSAFGGAEWTTAQGLAHIDALIAHMLATYPIDPADINMIGVSDGSLGVIAYSLQGAHDLRRRILISSAPQLILPAENLGGQKRFAAGRWDFLQGGHDRLFPAHDVFPYLLRFTSLYPNAHLHGFPEGEHDFSWWVEHTPDLLRGFFR